MVPEVIAETAKTKGINLIATGDFTHPLWIEDLKRKLVPAELGLYQLKEKQDQFPVRFIVGGEISSIYSRGGKTRRVHNVILLPSLESAEKINTRLSWQGNLHSDGRPILGMDSQELLKIVLDIEPRALFIPGHAWTPWFAVFGSMSGFNSLKEAFGDDEKYIHAIETGLSSDPAMNWRLSALDKVTLVSNSDAHSPDNLGREVNVFDISMSYEAMYEAIVKKDKNKFLYTIEFYPEEGKYHYDGHRLCQVSSHPSETKKYKGICPVCHKSLTIGVLSRVEELADRPEGYVPENAIPYKKLVPLKEIIADVLNVQSKTKKVEEYYHNLISHFVNEFNVLLETGIKELIPYSSDKIAEAIQRVRDGKLIIKPGYDGEYGKIKIFDDQVSQKTDGVVEQGSLFGDL